MSVETVYAFLVGGLLGWIAHGLLMAWKIHKNQRRRNPWL